MKFKLLFLSLFAALALTACDKKDAAPAADAKPAAEASKDAKPADAKPAEDAAKPAEEAKPADTAAVPTASDSGVPECEDFIKKYETCVNDKMPAEQREAMKPAFDQMRGAIKEMGDKTAAAEYCKQMTEQMKTSLEPLGCSF